MKAITVEPKKAGSAQLENVSEPDLRTGSVLVEGIAVGVCGTDVEITKGKYGQMCPGPSVCECSLRQNEQPSQQYHEQTCQMMIEFALFLVGKPLHRVGGIDGRIDPWTRAFDVPDAWSGPGPWTAPENQQSR